MKTVDQNRFFFLVMLLVSFVLASMAAKARAESELEGSCRAKAKEVAVQAYQSCMSDNRAAKVKELREGYKSELAEVKAKYDRMLKEAGAPATSIAAIAPTPLAASPVAPTATTATTKKTAKVARKGKTKPAALPRPAEEPVSGIAQRLPPKRNHNGPALPIQSVSDDQPVIAASNNDIPEIVPVTESPSSDEPMPTSDDASF